MRAALRLRKNDWIQRYFAFRTYRAGSPYRVVFRPQPYKILLILSHMRSGSSLLTHLLNANPEVIGYGETHLTYAQPADFQELLFRVYTRSQEFRTWKDVGNLRMHHQYAMDKILHNARLPAETLLESTSLKQLFLIREPERSIASLLDLKPHWGEAEAIAYYCDRLHTLTRYAQVVSDASRAFLVTYDQILDQTEAVLGGLQTFLQTKAPFSETYPLLKTTGQRGVGDSKGNIKAGKIIREKRPLSQPLSIATIHQAQTAYQKALEILPEHCTTIAGNF